MLRAWRTRASPSRCFGTRRSVSLLAAPGVLAGSVALKADVPFDFLVADRHLPSGEYRFVQGENPGVVRIYSKTQGHMATVLATRVPAAATQGGTLEFHRHGRQVFLKLISTGNGSGAYFPETGTEKALQPGAHAAPVVGMQ